MTTLLVGQRLTHYPGLVEALTRRFDLRTRSAPQSVHAGALRDAAIDSVLYLPAEERWQGMRAEGAALSMLLERCAAAGVRRFVLLGSVRVYGASAQHELLLDEDRALAQDQDDPSVAHAVPLDRLCTGWARARKGLSVCALRFVEWTGPDVDSRLERYLRAVQVPAVRGFDPLVQLIHLQDMADAIERALAADLRGPYHVCGAGAVPLSVVARERGVRRCSYRPARNWLAYRRGSSGVANESVGWLKYPLTVDDRRFRAATGFEPRTSLRDTIMAGEPPAPQRRARPSHQPADPRQTAEPAALA